jgi:ribonuclease HII
VPTFDKERSLFEAGYDFVIGIDEVGRGPWAGPVVACAAVLDKSAELIELVRDSKKLSENQRNKVNEEIRSNVVGFGIGDVSSSEIDELGLTDATQLAMRNAYEEALKSIRGSNAKVISLIDGYFPTKLRDDHTEEYIINGDEFHYSIAAASIIAKVYRDDLMVRFDEEYPDYGFGKHKGYGTKLHMEALGKFGITPIHRKSFKPIKKYVVDEPNVSR